MIDITYQYITVISNVLITLINKLKLLLVYIGMLITS